MVTIRDFMMAAKALANASSSRAFDSFFPAFDKFATFDEVPDSALNNLKENPRVVPADGFNVETRDQLVNIVEGLQADRQQKQKAKDDRTLLPLVCRGYDTQESYSARIGDAFLNIPAEATADLLFRNNAAVLDDLGWLDLTACTYRKESWATQRILTSLEHWNPLGVQIETQKFKEDLDYRRSYSLAAFMAREGTWPRSSVRLRKQV
jgi:hypothetical protein